MFRPQGFEGEGFTEGPNVKGSQRGNGSWVYLEAYIGVCNLFEQGVGFGGIVC